MNSEVATLWRELQDLLRERGVLTFQFDSCTPSEIAGAIARESGDPRVQRFVWEYYYPRCYGDMEGNLSDAEARSLVESYRKYPEPPPPAVQPSVQTPLCGVCQRHPLPNSTSSA
jgi:hypothetical protein